MYDVIRNQLRDGNPPETKQTLDRLTNQGIPEDEAMRMLAGALANEIYYILRDKRPYDRERYLRLLRRLPKESFD